MRRLLDVGVAVAAVDAEHAGVEAVVEGDGLVGRVTDVEILVGRILVDRGGHEGAGDDEAEEDTGGRGVGPAGEDIAPGGGTVEEID